MASDNITIRTRLLGAKRAAAEAKAVGSGVGGIGRSAKETDKHTRRMGKGFVYARKGIGPLRAGVTGLTGALGFGAGVGLIGAFKVMNDEARESQKTGRATAAVLKSTGASAWISRKQIEARATKLSEMSAVDDEVIQKSENMLLTFRDIRNEAGRGNKIFDRTNRAALDMAAGFTAAGKEMSPTDAALQLGKAVNDPVKGMTRLTRVGVTFTKQQTDQVAAMTKNGDKLGAQKVILAEINKEFGGQAKSQADPMKRLNVIMHNTAETIGLKLLPYIDKGAQKLGTWVKQISNGTGAGGRFRDQVVRIWKAAKPVVVWFGRAAKRVFEFTSRHPGMVKIAAALFLAHRALKLLRFGSAISGASRLFTWLGRSEKRISGMPAKAAATKGKWASVGGLLGKTLGAAAFAAFVVEFSPQLNNWLNEQFNKYNINDPLNFGGNPGTDPRKLAGQGKKSLAPDGGSWDDYMNRQGNRHRRRNEANRRTQRHLDPSAQRHDEGGRRRMAAPLAGPVIHNHFYVDGKEVTHSVARHTNADRNRR